MKEFCVENLIFITEIIIFKQKFTLRTHTFNVLNSIVGMTMPPAARTKLSPRSLNSIEEDPKYSKIDNTVTETEVVDVVSVGGNDGNDGDADDVDIEDTDIKTTTITPEFESKNQNVNLNQMGVIENLADGEILTQITANKERLEQHSRLQTEKQMMIGDESIGSAEIITPKKMKSLGPVADLITGRTVGVGAESAQSIPSIQSIQVITSDNDQDNEDNDSKEKEKEKERERERERVKDRKEKDKGFSTKRISVIRSKKDSFTVTYTNTVNTINSSSNNTLPLQSNLHSFDTDSDHDHGQNNYIQSVNTTTFDHDDNYNTSDSHGSSSKSKRSRSANMISSQNSNQNSNQKNQLEAENRSRGGSRGVRRRSGDIKLILPNLPENINFSDLSPIMKISDYYQCVRVIFDQFINENGKYQVNISGTTRKRLHKLIVNKISTIEENDINVFDIAAKQVWYYLRESFDRFKETSRFNEFAKKYQEKQLKGRI